MPELVLASTSRSCREQLERLGLPFETATPELDEARIRGETKDPIGLARLLAAARAEAAAGQHKKAIAIGCEQLCTLGDQILAAPDSAAAAAELLQQLQGNEHMLVTAVAVRKGKDVEDFVDVAMLRMRKLGKKEIERYVAADEPAGCAGGYRFGRAGIGLFEKVQAEDHSALAGMPLMKLGAALRKFGCDVP